jgi:hypothetical protein
MLSMPQASSEEACGQKFALLPLQPLSLPFGAGKRRMARRYFTEAEVQELVGKRVKRDDVIGEVKGYEYISDIEEEDEQYHAYSLLILWDGGTTEKVDRAAYRQGVEELE